jgi:putative phosphoesterase
MPELPDRFAVISDVHGNIDALTAVLADIAGQNVARIVNLGDHFSGPLAARETADLLCGHDMLCIRGNHDRWLVEIPPDQHSGSERAAYAQLSAAHLEWLRALPAVRKLGDVLMCHGTPTSDTEYFLERVHPDGTVVLEHPEQIEARALATDCTLILCGHTHLARRIDLRDGRVVVNPGSVGCPGYKSATPWPHSVQTGSPAARYAIVERSGAGWACALRSVPYDPSRMVELARCSLRPGWAGVLASGWVDD